MPPRRRRPAGPKCQICTENEPKYRCSKCPVRYCSVACYKRHKENDCTALNVTDQTASPSLDVPAAAEAGDSDRAGNIDENHVKEKDDGVSPLKALTEVSWPPEPDPGIFEDPLTRDDPKPLRREELMRIATSPQLRQLLSSNTLPLILRTLDAIPSPHARSTALARLLGVDNESLSKASSQSIVNTRDSPPALEDLLRAFMGEVREEAALPEEEGWYLGSGSGDKKVWIGEEEKKVMRIWARVVIGAIDDEGKGDEWGKGKLGWAV